ncbi:AMP-binding enzyme C-terminal domain-containing protein [Duganella sacchari]|uniref:AMP-binding enzyme C-terminal domain-containing protein n=1 Tax=Duganella sacchari TaxID=551987 RepID=A0A1M7KVB7_9BURK|nr:condensation domain-containing protein [Duganella sacchari]SHM69480.1 AMP-binding enzyme C-terminal domain-containing protein [Duganella sacchari]
MSAIELLDKLDAVGISLRLNGDKLSVVGDQRKLADNELMASLRSHKHNLIELLKQRASADPMHYVIPEGTQTITPDMLPLVTLEPAQIDQLVRATPGGAANIQDIYPLAPLQEGILFHHRVQAEGDMYVIPTLLRFDSRARLDGFVAALNQVIARHDILRTAVHWEGLTDPVQVVWRQAHVEVQMLAADPHAGDVLSQLQAYADPRHLRLDVRRAPMLAAYAIADTSTQTWLLQLLHHHLILDHTASALLIEEIVLMLEGRPAALPAPVPFRRFVAQARQGMDLTRHEEYFRRMLGDVDEPTAPFGVLDVQGTEARIGKATAQLTPALAARLRAQVKIRGVSAASLFHLAWAKVLSLCTGREDVVFGTVLFGRMLGGASIARAIGMFLNTLPLRVRLDTDQVEQGLKRTHGALIELLRHEHAPLPLAQRCSALPANTPLFTSLLNYRYSHEEEGGGVILEGIEHLGGHDRTNYPFVLHVDDLGESFTLSVEIHDSVPAQRVAAFMLQSLEGLVDALERNPQQPLTQLQALPAAERQQVLYGFNETATDYPAALLHELVEQQVARTPDAIAVRFEQHQLSYAALNAQANQLFFCPVPVGVAGEVYIGGVQVARGYLNRPQLTQERFLADPFVAGGRMYRTGDLGRWRADGAVDYLGRNDFQVKLRGFRIELGEIEAQLVRQPGVREAVVIARADGAGLIAYVVQDGVTDAAVLRAELGKHLPDYMIPAAYVQLAALPLSPNGKLDRKALPAPDGGAFIRLAYEAPAGEVEQALAQIWSELLGIERISRRDHFFELGGHSLLAIRLLEQLRQRGWSLDIRALFAHPGLAAMAAAIQLSPTSGSHAIDVPRNAIPVAFAASAIPENEETEEFRL